MADSLAPWLALRQAADFAARSDGLTRIIRARLAGSRPLRVLDLGTGTGSNLQYLGPRLGGDQHWLAVDKDPRLLAYAAQRGQMVSPAVEVETRALDLGAMNAPDLFDRRHLVTASALLDLVSGTWLTWVAGECHRVGAQALFTIIYSGRNECDPEDPDDARVFAWFNHHQRTDKGLGGVAAGPDATDLAHQAFAHAGFEVIVAPSDWRVGPEDREFQRQLIAGWASAAAEMAPGDRVAIDAWRQRRLQHVDAGRSRIVVGHFDLAALHRRRP